MANEWIMVRLRKATHARLADVRASLQRAYESGAINLELDDRGRVSLDQVVGLLIDARDAHAARRKRSARRPSAGATELVPEGTKEIT